MKEKDAFEVAQQTTFPRTQTEDYDYIICGGGCAGLSLAVHLIHSGAFTDKRILIIEEDAKQKNDRTWCFWEKDQGLFESIVRKQWSELYFQAPQFTKKLVLQPYTYKLIRGLDFYNYCHSIISEQSNIHLLQEKVSSITTNRGSATVQTVTKSFSATWVFNSILFDPPVLRKKDIWMLQHFKGWYIKTEKDVFDPTVGTLMDFRTGQDEGTTFFYILPLSEREALVEYTLFSPELLEENKYENALKQYISQQLGTTGYTILEKEFGVIPMTNHQFSKGSGAVCNIGTAGGYTKGSSGYTFRFIQKASAAIVKNLIEKGTPFNAVSSPARFAFYDAVLLQVLNDGLLNGAAVFEQLFKKNDPSLVLKFLDNETGLSEEVKIISSLPTLPFAQAALKQVF